MVAPFLHLISHSLSVSFVQSGGPQMGFPSLGPPTTVAQFSITFVDPFMHVPPAPHKGGGETQQFLVPPQSFIFGSLTFPPVQLPVVHVPPPAVQFVPVTGEGAGVGVLLLHEHGFPLQLLPLPQATPEQPQSVWLHGQGVGVGVATLVLQLHGFP